MVGASRSQNGTDHSYSLFAFQDGLPDLKYQTDQHRQSQTLYLSVGREAASAEIELQSLEEAQAACLRVGQLGDRPDIYGPLAQRLEQVASWLKQRASVGLKEQGRDRMEGVWSGQQVHSSHSDALQLTSGYVMEGFQL